MAFATRTVLTLVLGLAGLGFAGNGAAQEVGQTVVIREATDTDLYAAGRDVRVEATVAGDAVLAGGTVVVTGDVRDDVLAAGRNVTVSGDVGDDVRLAGRTVTVSGEVAGHAVMAGRETRVEAGTRIGDWAWIAGGRVYIAGAIGGDLKAAGRDIELTGRVDGDAAITGRRIRIGDGAVIGGDLTWRSENEPVIDDGAVITGQVIQGPAFERHERGGGLAFRLFAMLSVIFAAGVLYTMLRKDCETCATVCGTRPAICLLIGLAVFATTPLITALLFATGIGAVLGVVVLMSYGLALLLGFLTGITSLARLGLQWRRGDGQPSLGLVWVAIAIVGVLIVVLGPLGILVGFFLMLFGLGALSLEVYRRVRKKLVSDPKN